MRFTIFRRQPSVSCLIFAAISIAFLLSGAVRAQSISNISSWSFPGPNMKGSERGDFKELKDKSRVYVSVFSGSIQAPYGHTVKGMILEQIKQYDGLEIVESPDSAELAIHVRIGYADYRAREITAEFESFAPARKLAVSYYVSTRGKGPGNNLHPPRINFRSTGSDTEGSSTFAAVQTGTFIKKLKKLRGE